MNPLLPFTKECDEKFEMVQHSTKRLTPFENMQEHKYIRKSRKRDDCMARRYKHNRVCRHSDLILYSTFTQTWTITTNKPANCVNKTGYTITIQRTLLYLFETAWVNYRHNQDPELTPEYPITVLGENIEQSSWYNKHVVKCSGVTLFLPYWNSSESLMSPDTRPSPPLPRPFLTCHLTLDRLQPPLVPLPLELPVARDRHSGRRIPGDTHRRPSPLSVP